MMSDDKLNAVLNLLKFTIHYRVDQAGLNQAIWIGNNDIEQAVNKRFDTTSGFNHWLRLWLCNFASFGRTPVHLVEIKTISHFHDDSESSDTTFIFPSYPEREDTHNRSWTISAVDLSRPKTVSTEEYVTQLRHQALRDFAKQINDDNFSLNTWYLDNSDSPERVEYVSLQAHQDWLSRVASVPKNLVMYTDKLAWFSAKEEQEQDTTSNSALWMTILGGSVAACTLLVLGTTVWQQQTAALTHYPLSDHEPSSNDARVGTNPSFPSSFSFQGNTEIFATIPDQAYTQLISHGDCIFTASTNSSQTRFASYYSTTQSHVINAPNIKANAFAYFVSNGPASRSLFIYPDATSGSLNYQSFTYNEETCGAFSLENSPGSLNISNVQQPILLKTTVNGGDFAVIARQPDTELPIKMAPIYYSGNPKQYSHRGPITAFGESNDYISSTFVRDPNDAETRKGFLLSSSSSTTEGPIVFYGVDGNGNYQAITHLKTGLLGHLTLNEAEFNEYDHALLRIEGGGQPTLAVDYISYFPENKTVNLHGTGFIGNNGKPTTVAIAPPATIQLPGAANTLIIPVCFSEAIAGSTTRASLAFVEYNYDKHTYNVGNPLPLWESGEGSKLTCTGIGYYYETMNFYISLLEEKSGQKNALYAKTFGFTQNRLPSQVSYEKNKVFYPFSSYKAAGLISGPSYYVDIHGDQSDLMAAMDYQNNEACQFTQPSSSTLRLTPAFTYVSGKSIQDCINSIEVKITTAPANFKVSLSLFIGTAPESPLLETFMTIKIINKPQSNKLSPLHLALTILGLVTSIPSLLWRAHTIKKYRKPFEHGELPIEKLAFLLKLSRREALYSGGGEAATTAFNKLLNLVQLIVDKGESFTYFIGSQANTIDITQRLESISDSSNSTPTTSSSTVSLSDENPLYRMDSRRTVHPSDRLIAAYAIAFSELIGLEYHSLFKRIIHLFVYGDDKPSLSDVAKHMPTKQNDQLQLAQKIFVIATASEKVSEHMQRLEKGKQALDLGNLGSQKKGATALSRFKKTFFATSESKQPLLSDESLSDDAPVQDNNLNDDAPLQLVA